MKEPETSRTKPAVASVVVAVPPKTNGGASAGTKRVMDQLVGKEHINVIHPAEPHADLKHGYEDVFGSYMDADNQYFEKLSSGPTNTWKG